MKTIIALLFGLLALSDSFAADLLNTRPVGSVLNAVYFPPVLDPRSHGEGTSYLVLAESETNATVIFDGSASSDAQGRALRYLWGTIDEQFYPVPGTTWSLSPYLTNHFRANMTGYFYLDAELAEVDPRNWTGLTSERIQVTVLSPSQAVIALGEWLDDNFESRGVQKVFLPTLDQAAQQFRDGNTQQATLTLQTFQRQVKQRMRHGPTRKALIAFTQTLIEVVRPSSVEWNP